MNQYAHTSFTDAIPLAAYRQFSFLVFSEMGTSFAK